MITVYELAEHRVVGVDIIGSFAIVSVMYCGIVSVIFVRECFHCHVSQTDNSSVRTKRYRIAKCDAN